jgi:hypothetical protein
MMKRMIALLVAACVAGLSLPVQAAMIPTPTERDALLRVLERAEVQQQLRARGVSVDDAKARIAALSDVEAAELAARIDELPAGGASILGVALVVFLVLLLTDILGYTKVFPFTKPMK